jgi:hypothetical protein
VFGLLQNRLNLRATRTGFEPQRDDRRNVELDWITGSAGCGGNDEIRMTNDEWLTMHEDRRFTLAEAVAQFQQEKLLALSFQLSARGALLAQS